MMTTFSDAASALREQFRIVFAKCVLFATGGFVLISALGFDPNDPSFNRAADNDPVNYAGLAGAFVADPLLQFFGQAVFLVPLVCFARVFRPESAKALALRPTWLCVPMRFFSFAGMILSACALCSVIPANESWPFYTGYGGAFGDLLLKAAENAGLPGVLLWVPLFPGCLLLILCAAGYEGWIPVIFGRTASLRPGAINLAERLRDAAAAAKERAVILADQMDEAPDPDAPPLEERPKPKRRQKGKLLKKLRAFQGVAEDPDDPDGQTAEDHDAAFEEPADPQATLESLASRRKEAVKKRSVKAKRAEQEQRAQEARFKMPPMNLLVPPAGKRRPEFSRESMERNADLLGQVLQDFGVYGKILNYRPGPVVTLYEMEPSPGTKSSRVIGLADDIARSMSALSARISVIPGRNLLGVELPNAEREIVLLREILETPAYEDGKNRLPLALGKDIGGSPVIADLSRMPHLLVAGTTGSGKSVAVNAMILSLLYRLPPEECRFIMIDPKMLELSVYDGIPHLLSPVVTEPAKAVAALKWVVKEMENRYRLMSQMGVRNVAGFNKRVEESLETGEQPTRTVQTGFDAMSGEPIYEETELELRKLPFIVVIVDEMADLMLTAGKEIEGSIQRLAQMARAAGIHIIMATQRPSVDVITGVIKANFPTRISFQVTSRIDSRTILGEMGAEQLLGMGDMLYMSGGTRLTRVHGPFVEDDEVEKVVRHLKSQGSPEYVDDVTRLDDDPFAGGTAGGEEGDLYRKAVAVVVRDKRASTSYVQRQLKIGYNRAADLIDRMEKEGVVSAPNHAGKREVLG